MEFNPAIFDELNSPTPNQIIIDQLSATIEELHNNPQFAFVLLESIKTQACQNEFQLKSVLITLKNNISKKWNIPEYWDLETKKAIIAQLFEILYIIPYDFRSYVTYIFDSVSGKTSDYENEWVTVLIQLFDEHTDLEEIVSLIQISFFWVRSHQGKMELIDPEIDQLMTTLIEKSKAAFDQVVGSVDENPSCALFATQFIKLVRYYIRCSLIAMSNGYPDAFLEQFIPLLNSGEDCDEKIDMKVNVLKTIKVCFAEYLGKSKRKIGKTGERLTFNMHFREDIVPQIVEAFKQFASIEHSPKLMVYIFYILYQIIEFNLDESIIDENLFSIMIQQSALSPDSFEDPIENPQVFMEQQMTTELYDDVRSVRSLSANIIERLVKNYNFEAETIIPYITPDLEHEEPQIVDSKIFLLLALSKSILSKQRILYKKAADQARKMKQEIDEFVPEIPIPAEFAEMCVSLIGADSIPIYLILSSMHLLSKLIIFVDAEKGIEIALTIMQNEAVALTPLIAIYSSKLFNKSAKVIEDLSAIDVSEYITPVIEATNQIHTNSVHNMLTTLRNKSPESMCACIPDIIQYYCTTLCETPYDENDSVKRIYEIIYDLIKPFQTDTEFIGQLFEPIVTASIEKIKENGVDFPNDQFYMILAMFSNNFTVHPPEMYQVFMSLYELLMGDENFLCSTSMIEPKYFLSFVYPLIVDPESEIPQSPEFNEAIVTIALKMFETVHNDSTGLVDENNIAYIILLMAVITQKYGIIPDFLTALCSEAAKQFETNSPDEIEDEVAKSFIVMLSSCAVIDISILGPFLENAAFIEFIIEKCNTEILDTFNLLKYGVNLLLLLTKCGVNPAFQVAASLISDLKELHESDDEDEEEDEEGGEEEEEGNDEEEEGGGEEDGDGEEEDDEDGEEEEDSDDDDDDDDEDSDDDDNEFEFSYPLPQDSNTIMNNFMELLAENESLPMLIEDEEERNDFIEQIQQMNGEVPF